MSELMIKLPVPLEPKRANRFIITFIGNNLEPIPVYLFKSYKLKNEGEELILTIKMLEPLHFTYNPKELYNILDVKIEFLDPIGGIVNGLILPIIGSNHKQSGNYKSNKLLTNKFRFIIDGKNIQTLYKNTINDGENK